MKKEDAGDVIDPSFPMALVNEQEEFIFNMANNNSTDATSVVPPPAPADAPVPTPRQAPPPPPPPTTSTKIEFIPAGLVYVAAVPDVNI